MTAADPRCFARTADELRTWQSLAARVARAGGQARHRAGVAAFAWALDGGPAPVSGRTVAVSMVSATAEHTAALIVAEVGQLPAGAEWEGVDRPSSEWAYGAWRVLAWLISPAADTPVALWEGPARIRPWESLPPDARVAVGKAFSEAGLAGTDLDPRSTPRPTTRPPDTI